MISQVQVIGLPRLKSWDDFEAGCLATFGGGYHDEHEREIFRHGMSTVFNLLHGEFPSAESCKSTPHLLDALDCCIRQLEIAASEIDAVTDSPSWQDLVNGCRKQAQVARTAIEKASKGTP